MPTYDAQLFLAGAYVDGDTDDVVTLNSPVTGEHLADLPVPSRGQVDTAVAAARTAFDDYRHWSALRAGRSLSPGRRPHRARTPTS